MPPERQQSNSTQLTEIKGMLSSVNEKIDQVHGRIKRVESVVLGDEEKSIIGLAEKFRVLETGNRVSDAKRATFFVCVGWLAAFLGQYVLTQYLPQKAIPVSIESTASKSPVSSR